MGIKRPVPPGTHTQTQEHLLSLSLGNSMQPGLEYAWNELSPIAIVKQDGGAPLWGLETGGGMVTGQ